MFNKNKLKALTKSVHKWEEGLSTEEGRKLPERKARFTSASGMDVSRMYTPADLDENFDYAQKLGFPGEYPFTRGVKPTMYRSRFWTMRQYAGFGTARETNERYRYLLQQGQTGLSVAFDLPTQAGYDSDHPLCAGEVGTVGVAIDSLDDMRTLFEGIPLDEVTTSMTINATAIILLAMYLVLAEEQGIPWTKLGGTVQNDILKEIICRGLYIYPPQPSMRLTTDIIEFCQRHVPNWNTISISGYHIREAGATAIQEMAFTFADGIAYVQAAIDRGLEVDSFAPRLSFFFNAFTNVLEEVAKFRAGRRYWARLMKERFQAKDPRSMMLRFHVQTGGVTLTAQQPKNNIVRVALQALAAAYGGTQSLHTNSFDEALCLPTQEAVTLALRTQQIIAEESGAADTIDPLAGSYYVEAMTDRIEAEIDEYTIKIDAMGGTLKAIDQGYVQKEIQNSSYLYQKEIESRERIYVGINKYTADEQDGVDILSVDPKQQEIETDKLRTLREQRNREAWKSSLDNLNNVTRTGENVFPAVLRAVKARATVGEICDVWRDIFGEYRPKEHI